LGNIVVIYHDDLDGQASAQIFIEYNKYNKRDKLILMPSDYDKELDYNSFIKPDDIVYCFDFKPDIKKILDITEMFVWIDHHKTAIESEYNNDSIKGIRSDKFAACELVWRYFFSNEKFPELFKVPLAVQYIGNYDSWKWKELVDSNNDDDNQLGYNSCYFYEGMLSEPRIFDMLDLCIFNSKDSDKWVDIIIRRGKIVDRFLTQDSSEVIKNNAYKSELDGYSCYCCNTTRHSSLLFDSIDDEYDVMVAYNFNGNNWCVSLYSKNKNVDVSDIAKKYGGGGHKGAAGFTAETIPKFLKINK
jgi:oligoribonuclease NrnB/cAMP/cGMP phosphodiesterase (DHH superfamily)